jgi:hypothetical protein
MPFFSSLFGCGWFSAVDIVDVLDKAGCLNPVKVIQGLAELFLNESIQTFCGKSIDA